MSMMSSLLALAMLTVANPTEVLYSEVGAPGESLDDFAMRIAPKARETTRELGSEICGSFQKSGSTYRITLSTNRNPWGCNIDFANEGDWKATRWTLHTHTEKGGHTFSAQDDRLKLQGYVVSFHAVTKRIGNLTKTVALP